MAVGGSRQHIFNSRVYSPKHIFCFEQNNNIASYPVALMIRNNYVLKLRIDKLAQFAFDGGLVLKWYRDYYYQNRIEKRNVFSDFEVPITLDNMSFNFVLVFCIGVVLSTLSFLAEIIIFRKMQQPSQSWVWKYCAQFFDGERHHLTHLADEVVVDNFQIV